MLIQIDFEFFVPTDQGRSFRVGRALSREAGPWQLKWVSLYIFIYVCINRPIQCCHLY